jgi:leucyl-tRNA synthetase
MRQCRCAAAGCSHKFRCIITCSRVANVACGHTLRSYHAYIQVTVETEELRFNTAIAAMMEFINAVYKWPNRPRAALQPFVLLLAPYAPHLAEELWSQLGGKGSLTYEPWPQYDEALLVQVRGGRYIEFY